MTEQEYRDLDKQVAEALGWRIFAPDILSDYWRLKDGKGLVCAEADSRAAVEGWMDRYTTDPTATAEVKRFVLSRGWKIRSSISSVLVSVTVRVPDWPIFYREVELEGSDGDNDPVRAESVCLCGAFLAAVGATETKEATDNA